MRKTGIVAALSFGLLVLSVSMVFAQGSTVITVRQGDTIEWTSLSAGPHRVRFGSSGAAPALADLNKLLEFPDPNFPLTTGDSKQAVTGKLLVAKVKEDPETVGKTFVFVCGVHSAGQMVSLPFTIAVKVAGETKTHRITGETGLHWHLHIDTTP